MKYLALLNLFMVSLTNTCWASGKYRIHFAINTFENRGGRCADEACNKGQGCCQSSSCVITSCNYTLSLCRIAPPRPINYLPAIDNMACINSIERQRLIGVKERYGSQAMFIFNGLNLQHGVQIYIELRHSDSVLVDKFLVVLSSVGYISPTIATGVFGLATITYTSTLTCHSPFCGRFCELNKDCTCQPGYTGIYCSEKIDYCLGIICNNSHSECISDSQSYECTCLPGFTGANCQNDLNECVIGSEKCNFHGVCVNDFGSFHCECSQQYTGQFCETRLGKYSVEATFHSFQNPGGKCADIGDTCLNGSGCCDDVLCHVTTCDYMFLICWREVGTPISVWRTEHRGHCSYLETSSHVAASEDKFSAKVYGISNPILFSSDIAPIHRKELHIELVDDDKPEGNNELIDRFVIPITGNSVQTKYSGIFGLAEIVLSISIDCSKDLRESRKICRYQNSTVQNEKQPTASTSAEENTSLLVFMNITKETPFVLITNENISKLTQNIVIAMGLSSGIFLLLLTSSTILIVFFLCHYNNVIKDKFSKFSGDSKGPSYDFSIHKGLPSQQTLSLPTVNDSNNFVITNSEVVAAEYHEDSSSWPTHIYDVIKEKNHNGLNNQDSTSQSSQTYNVLTRGSQDEQGNQDSSSQPSQIYNILTRGSQDEQGNQDLSSQPSQIYNILTRGSQDEQGNQDSSSQPSQIYNILTRGSQDEQGNQDSSSQPSQIYNVLTQGSQDERGNQDSSSQPSQIYNVLTQGSQDERGNQDSSSQPSQIYNILTRGSQDEQGNQDSSSQPSQIYNILTRKSQDEQSNQDASSQSSQIYNVLTRGSQDVQGNQDSSSQSSQIYNVLTPGNQDGRGNQDSSSQSSQIYTVLTRGHHNVQSNRDSNSQSSQIHNVLARGHQDVQANQDSSSQSSQIYTVLTPGNQDGKGDQDSITQSSQIYNILEQDNKIEQDIRSEQILVYSPVNVDDEYDYASEYWTPSSVEEDLIMELVKLRVRIIPATDLIETAVLGRGAFGIVCKGVWKSKSKQEVAIKKIEDGASEEDRIHFLQEAAIMGQFNHPNIVTIVGVVTDQNKKNFQIIMELMQRGSLHCHLPSMKKRNPDVLPSQLLSFSRQIASAMSYLATKGYIHRDLAARNVLLSNDETCKIADFGLSRDLSEEGIYQSRGGMIPIKWTAPESIMYRTWSSASDVWSYGCILYEIWSLGAKPFQNYTNKEALQMISQGYRLPPPPGCPRIVYEIMINSWNIEPEKRPLFSGILSSLLCPDYQVLTWSTEDQQEYTEQSRTVSGILEDGQNLFQDLQDAHKN